MMRSSSFLPAALGAVLLISPVAAADRNNGGRERVSFADLDVHSVAGQTALHWRVRAAAERVCGLHDATTLRERTLAKRCVDHAVVKGDMQIGDEAAGTDILVARAG